jgi:PPK2 family polyphosphate:nucleotide phosphotransferase
VKPKHVARLLDRYRVTDGKGFALSDHDPADKGGGLVDHANLDKSLAEGVEKLSELQIRLYAAQKESLLIVLQAMDAAGKDGTIKHVMTGVNPQGVDVTSFKQPGPIDLMHGFLWRVHAAAPMRGRIAIFNRSHYEDVLVCRVHPELLDKQNLPDSCRGRKFWKHRLEDIVNFESYMAHQGTKTIKIFLNVSKDEQKRRFLSRIDEPHKNWKFSAADLHERDFWDAYQDAYEAAITATAQEEAPWFVVPADNKPFAHLVVAEAVIEALEALDLKEPSPPEAEVALLKEARKKLEGE